MSGESNHESRLSAVQQTDWLSLVFEDVIDPEHKRRWEEFSAENPEFARELAIYAYHEAEGRPDSIQASINTALWAIASIRNAWERTSNSTVGQPEPEAI